MKIYYFLTELITVSIPEELKSVPQWVCWKYVHQDGKQSKVAFHPTTNKYASSTNPKTWGSFEEAMASCQDGIAFAFDKNDPYTVIELKQCYNEKKESFYPWAEDIIKKMNSYSEFSLSEDMAHIIVRGGIPLNKKHTIGRITLYNENKYLTLTGNSIDIASKSIEDRKSKVKYLVNYLFEITDDDIMHSALRAKNKDKFSRLMDGDWSEYESESDADMALCMILAFWVGPDDERIAKLFRRSQLSNRAKWKNREDYRSETIKKAISIVHFRILFTKDHVKDRIRTIEDSRGLCKDNVSKVHSLRDNISSTNSRTSLNGICVDPYTKNKEGGGAAYRQGIIIDEIVLEFAKSINPPIDEFKHSFALARKFRALSNDDPDQYKPAIEKFCKEVDCPFLPFWHAFLECWQWVEFPEKENSLGWAINQAIKFPYPMEKSPSEQYSLLASIAWHLSKLKGDEPFWLPIPSLIKPLGCNHPMEVSRIIKLLEQRGIIQCVVREYSFRKGRARHFIFVGPKPKGD